jgi:hypothetical protein
MGLVKVKSNQVEGKNDNGERQEKLEQFSYGHEPGHPLSYRPGLRD